MIIGREVDVSLNPHATGFLTTQSQIDGFETLARNKGRP